MDVAAPRDDIITPINASNMVFEIYKVFPT